MKQLYSFCSRCLNITIGLITIVCVTSVSAQNITTMAGNGTGGYSGDGNPAVTYELHNPTTSAIDAAGNLYIADWANARVRKVTPAGTISTIAGTGTSGYNGDNQPATAAWLKQPNGVAVDAAGNVFIAEMSGYRIRKIDAVTGYITTIAGTGSAGSTGDNGPASNAKLTSPTNIAIDGAGNIYIADWGNHKIRLITASTGIITTIAGGPTSGFSGDNGPATAAFLNNPYSVSLDALNNLYISDEHNYRLRKINLTTGIITTIAGIGPPGGFGGDGGPATGAQFNQPDGIVADAGALYIADFSNNRIRKVDLSTGIINTVVGNGTGGFAGDGGPATSSLVEINGPTGILLDPTGNVYITDFTNNRIRKVSINNHAPYFDSGHVQHLNVCENGSKNITSYLAITDSDVSQTETWSLYSAPVNGQLYSGVTAIGVGTVATGTSTGGILSFGGGAVVYVPVAGSTFPDSFVFRVNDGISIDSEKFYINVNPLPLADVINGPSSLCAGSTITLTDDSTGGTWISRNTTVATINSGGVVTGITGGATDSILYVVSNTCGFDTVYKVITVSTTPGVISPSGAVTVCIGGSVDLSDGIPGGTWSASNGHATVSLIGHVTGVTAGLDTITYAIGSCSVTKVVTVNGPSVITPHAPTICQGGTVSLFDASGGGSWSSAAPATATVSIGGLVTGIAAGSVAISYTLGGCSTMDTITVISAPASISPSGSSVCVGSSVSYTDVTGSGTWSVTNGHASISGGLVTGISAGVDTIVYTVGTCSVSATVTVVALPASITPAGAVTVCAGSTVTLSDATSLGIWSSTAPATATVGTGGVVTGITAGTTTISYTVNGCAAVKQVTVNGPAAILPNDPTICAGATVSLADGSGGGSWSSGAPGIATISGSGLVTGVAAGIAPITYTLGSCNAYDTVIVTAGVASITPSGAVTVCAGATTSLADGTSGGAWTSGTPAVATVSGSGVVTGLTAGTVTITYTVGSCFATKPITVNLAPAGLSPSSANICVGNTATFTDALGGGTWTSSAPGIASVSAGTVTAVAPGTAIITYSIGLCSVTASVTVNATSGAGTITGPSSVCVGSGITLTDVTPGGTWSSGTPAIASVSGSGLVTGISGGIATISYTVSNACGSVSTTATVNVVPAGVSPVVGPSSICAGTFATLTDATTGGSWSASNATATISGAGLITGITPGIDTITYTVVNVCGSTSAKKIMTIGAFLTAGTITGGNTVCAGAAITLSDLAPGGVWSASNTHATVAAGVVTGVSAGVDTISYTVTSGCGSAVATHVVTVNALPAAGSITGPSGICIGSGTLYTDAAPGGSWSMTNTHASVVGSGLVTPLTVGVDTLIYTVTNTCGTANTRLSITIGAFLSAGSISGPVNICMGTPATLTDGAPGGIWSASNGNATISGTGIVNGVMPGVDTFSYTVSGSCGTAVATYVITVNVLPAAGSISGPSSVCMGSAIPYTDIATGGVWSVSNAHATISGTGLFTPVSAGTDTISYTVSTVCGVAVATKVVTIGAFLSAGTILGVGNICAGSSILFTDATPGGSWSATSTNAAVSGTGLVTGLAAGTDSILYTVSGSCGAAVAIFPVTVTALPSAGSISAPSSMCTGANSLFTDAISGGTWSSSNALATVSTAGLVSAIAPGTDTIYYTVSNFCGAATAASVLTINLSPDAGIISGPTMVCAGASITLTDPSAGGVWSSSNGTASVTGTGVVTGIANGADTILYTVSGVCGSATASYVIGVGAAATAGTISGPASVCVASLITLGDTVAGGSWSSSNANATVAAGGVVTGILPGIDTISYTVTGACGVGSATYAVTIDALPVAGSISGPSLVCVGDSIALSDPAPGGVWSASNPDATAGSASGIVTGVSSGTDVILYTVANACGSVAASYLITVSDLPVPGFITGPDSLCAGTSITLSDLVPGGTWSAGNGNASVSGSGTVTGLAAGTDPISYSLTNSCGTSSAVLVVTVNAPDAGTILGSSSVCVGSGITLSDIVAGGTWSVSNATALMAGPGIVDGITTGVDTVFYSVSGICGSATAARVISVNPVPVVAAISGPASLCTGTVVTLTDATSGGIWSSSTPAVANIGSSSGIVSGISVGTSTITYTVTNAFGCPTSVTSTVTVNIATATPAITGPSSVCPSSSITLSDPAGGGSWSSAAPSVATAGSTSGIITGVSAGTATISYMVSGACGVSWVTRIITVNPLPVVAAISGTASECPGAATTLSDATPGGIWSSSNPSIATVGSASGIVTGIASGTATVLYTLTNTFGCTLAATVTNTVNAAPVVAAIAGATSECLGASVSLTDATLGGTWSSSNPSVAAVGSGTGLVTGVAAGVVTITYTVPGTGCAGIALATDTVNTVPVYTPVVGSPDVCLGGTTTLSDPSFGGTWSSGNPAVATISPVGVVAGVATGTAEIYYTVSNACGSMTDSVLVTTQIAPVAGTISGPSSVCQGATITLSDPATGGTWSSLNARATVAGGITTGISAGADTIKYTVTNACGSAVAAKPISVISAPYPGLINGLTSVCEGASIALSETVSGGSWSSGNTAIATVSGGNVTGVSVGSASISYAVGNSCGTRYATHAVDVVSADICNTLVHGTQPAGASVAIYPNPASEVLTIDAPVKVTVQILSADGKVMMVVHDATTVDVSRLPDALYVVLVYDEQAQLLKTARFAKVK